MRAAIARQLGISEKNDFALLAAIGGECAGAVTVLPQNISIAQLKPDYKIIEKQGILFSAYCFSFEKNKRYKAHAWIQANADTSVQSLLLYAHSVF